MSYTDPEGVERHRSLDDAPLLVLKCWGWGHGWIPGPAVETNGWGDSPVWTVRAECPCERIRTDVIDPVSGELLARDYSGGHGLAARERPDVQSARLVFIRRAKEAAAGAESLADKRRSTRRGKATA